MASPEVSAAYLARYNFKTLMEWLTARCILHRPDDPMVFCRDLLDSNIEARGGKGVPYDPNCAPGLLKGCYDDAMNAADEHGIIHADRCKEPLNGHRPQAARRDSTAGADNASFNITTNGRSTVDTSSKVYPMGNEVAPISTAPQASSKNTAAAAPGDDTSGSDREHHGVRGIDSGLLSVFREMCEVARPEIAAAAVLASACKAVNAQQGSLFKVINEAGELRETGSADSSSKRRIIKPGQGIIGKSAAGKSDTAIIVVRPSNEEGFSPDTDLPRGVTPTGTSAANEELQLMCATVNNCAGGVWGVLTVANPAGDENAFNEETLGTFRAVSDMVGVAMRNSETFGLKEREGDKFRNMLDVIEATNGDLGVNHLLYTIAKCLPVICDAQKCTAFVVDDGKDELWAVQGEVNIRVPRSKGIVGAVATTGEAENISDVYADPRFNKEVDVTTGFRTHSILAMPVRGGGENKVIAVIQLINKQGTSTAEGRFIADPTDASCEAAAGARFTEQDAAVIGTFLALLGPHIFQSSMFQHNVNIKVGRTIESAGEEEAFPSSSVRLPRMRSNSSLHTGIVHEGVEEEEEGVEDGDNDGGAVGSDVRRLSFGSRRSGS